MRKIGGILFLSVSAYLLTGCTTTTTPASNTAAANSAPANASAKPAAAAPAPDALLALDKQATEAWTTGNADFFKGFLSDKAVGFEGPVTGKDGIVKMISGVKCDMKSSAFDEPKMVNIDADNYVLTYKGTFDGTCSDNGKSMKVPSPVRAATLYTRSGDKWQAVWHGEVPIMAAGAPPKADDKKADDSKTAVKKDEPKKDDSKAENKATDTSAPAAVPAKSANTDALVKMHQLGWEAFKAKDPTWFNANLVDSAVFVSPTGDVVTGKADVVKTWTTEDCKDITKVGVSDGYSVSLSPTMELFHVKGNADGTCDGHKNGDLWQTAVYVKQGDAWKLAFMLEQMPMPGM